MWTSINPVPVLPKSIRETLQTLRQARGSSTIAQAYVVGGCVRDLLLGQQAKDYDIATELSPDEVRMLFPDAVWVGHVFGVCRLPLAESPYFVEIASFRKEGAYRNHRHPEQIEAGTLADDAARRDFTMNALYLDVFEGGIYDAYQGKSDLEGRVLRCVGNAADRFREDSLRILRAVRFAAKYGLVLAPELIEGAKQEAHLIHSLSGERVRDELERWWTPTQISRGFRAMQELELISRIFPEVKKSPQWSLFLRLIEAALVHQFSFSSEFVWCCLAFVRSHDAPQGIREFARRFRQSSDWAARLSVVLENLKACREPYELRDATLVRLAHMNELDMLLNLMSCVNEVVDREFSRATFLRQELSRLRDLPLQAEKLLTGRDLVDLGYRPGPIFAEILSNLEVYILEGSIQNREEALDYVINQYPLE